MRKHEAVSTELTLDAEQMELDTFACMSQDGDSITAFNRGKHCDVMPPLCVLEKRGGWVWIAHVCGMADEMSAALA